MAKVESRTVGAFDTLDVSVAGRVAWVCFNRPGHRNATTGQMVDEMYSALSELARRVDVSVVALVGKGKTFNPGADLNREPGVPPALPAPESYHSGRLLAEMPQVTVAAINGACAGAGLAWAAACDLRVASSGARMALGFVDVGVSGELGAGWTLTRMLGAARARELYFVPRKFTADEALAFGLVGRVFPAATFDDDVEAYVQGLAAHEPAALRDIKANLVDAESLPLADYVDVEARRHLSRFQEGAEEGTFSRFAERLGSLSQPSPRGGSASEE